MKARYIVTMLLIGMFAVGVPVGIIADENLDGPVTEACGGSRVPPENGRSDFAKQPLRSFSGSGGVRSV